MSLLTVLALSLATSTDAFAICFAMAMNDPRMHRRLVLRSAVFGVAAIVMLTGGIVAVQLLDASQTHYSGLAGNCLIAALGFRIVRSGINDDSPGESVGSSLLTTAVISSFDCFLVGLSLELERTVSPWHWLSFGGFSTGAAFLGLWLARRLTCLHMQGLGGCSGLILILVGIAGAIS
ncbi:MAG: manganese efflux pump [Planctomycetota bacterium]